MTEQQQAKEVSWKRSVNLLMLRVRKAQQEMGPEYANAFKEGENVRITFGDEELILTPAVIEAIYDLYLDIPR